MVERDLGELTSFNAAHQHVDSALADDLMLVKSDPIEFKDVCGDEVASDSSTDSCTTPQLAVGSCATPPLAVGSCTAPQLAVGSCSRLGPKSRRWAVLWRSIFGARLGCYRKGAPSNRAKRPGTYTAAKAGILAAAEYAVAVRTKRIGNPEQEANALTPLGVSKTFLKSALGDNARLYHNDKIKRFQALTNKKKLTNRRFMGQFVGSQNKWKSTNSSKPAEKLQNIKKVCFVGEIGESLPCPIAQGQPGREEVRGRKRSLHTNLAVVDDLDRLFACTDEATVNQVLGIIGRGVPAITRASWMLAGGDPECVPKESVIRHCPLAQKKKVVFEFDAHFAARSNSLVDSLKALAEMPQSTWKVRRSVDSAVGESGYAVVKLNGSEGVDVMRSWIREQRRIINAVGSKAWSLTQPMF